MRACMHACIHTYILQVLFKCMSEDDKADVRWMLSHAIHCYPPLFEPDCAPVLCHAFERLCVCACVYANVYVYHICVRV